MDESPVAGVHGMAEATALQEKHPLLGGRALLHEEASTGEVVAESSRVSDVGVVEGSLLTGSPQPRCQEEGGQEEGGEGGGGGVESG